MSTHYSWISIVRTLTCSPWSIRTHFWVPTKFFQQLKKKLLTEMFLFYCEIICCMYSLVLPHQVYFKWVNSAYNYRVENKRKSVNYHYLLPDQTPWLTLSGSNYPCFEQLSMVPKIFQPLKFECTFLLTHLCKEVYSICRADSIKEWWKDAIH